MCTRIPVYQWLPESARYDVLTGNQEKALCTLRRIAMENKVPMPLGKLIAARQVIQHKAFKYSGKSIVHIHTDVEDMVICLSQLSSLTL